MSIRSCIAASCRFLVAENGSVAMMMAILLPIMAMGTLGAVEHVNLIRYKIKLQDATDAAALAAAREIPLLVTVSGVDIDTEITRVAHSILDTNIPAPQWPVELQAERIAETTVQIDTLIEAKSMFAGLLGADIKRIEARAVAQVLGGADVCAVALGEEDIYTLDLTDTARITGPGCAIYSNSTHSSGVSVLGDAKIEAAQICSAGGARGMSSAYDPRATTDCPPLKDPLAHKLDSIASVAGGSCVDSGPTTLDGLSNETLAPGRYCHTVRVMGEISLTLSPGVFVFDDAAFILSGNAVVTGEDVALIFTGETSRMVIDGNADVRFKGREAGDMAGILAIAEPRADAVMREFTIISPNVHELVGTIYIPGDHLNILTNDEVAGDSAFTVVIARRIQLHGSASLRLNRDYSATSVPKSEGLLDYGGALVLLQ